MEDYPLHLRLCLVLTRHTTPIQVSLDGRVCSLDYDVTLVKDAHSTWDRELLTAPQIIAHHNALLSDWFVTTKDERDILFEDDLASQG